MYYVEYIARDRSMPVEVFRTLADQAASWVDGQVDRMVLQLGRTLRLGPHPGYLALWHIPGIARLDAWEAYFASDAYRAGNRRSHAMHRAIDISDAGLYDALVEHGTEPAGLHLVERFDSAAEDSRIEAWFRTQPTGGGRLAYVLRRVGLLGPDPAHLAVWSFADYAACESFVRTPPAGGEVRIATAGAYRWLGQEVL
ncbi:MAG: hypothetical protein ACREER_11540 [Alphaproteobacteria bacterium]